jgi:hypothetical protein
MRVRRALFIGLLLLAVGLLLLRGRATREFMNADCGCSDPTYEYDAGKKKCIKEVKETLEANPESSRSTTCTDGSYTYDSVRRKCTKVVNETLEANPLCCGLGQVWDPIQSKCTTSPGKQGPVMEVP